MFFIMMKCRFSLLNHLEKKKVIKENTQPMLAKDSSKSSQPILSKRQRMVIDLFIRIYTFICDFSKGIHFRSFCKD
jgi:hypothetical protein